MRVKEDNEKAGLKLNIEKKKQLNIEKTKIMASSPSLHGKEMEK